MRTLGRCLGILAAAAAVALGATATVGTSAAWVDTVQATGVATIGTWDTPPPGGTGPFAPGPDTDITVSFGIPGSNLGGFCSIVTVSTTSTTPVVWSFTIDLAQPPFHGSPNVATHQDTMTVDPADPGRRIVTGPGHATTVVAGSPRDVAVCVDNPINPPPAADSWFTVTQVPGPATATQACLAVTVTGTQDLASNPFFFGWQVDIDLGPVNAALIAAGGAVTHVSWSPDMWTGTYTATPLGNDVYRITSGYQLAIKGTQSVTITACVHGFAV